MHHLHCTSHDYEIRNTSVIFITSPHNRKVLEIRTVNFHIMYGWKVSDKASAIKMINGFCRVRLTVFRNKNKQKSC